RRHIVPAFRPDEGCGLGDLAVTHPKGVARDREAQEARLIGEREIRGDAAAGGRGHEVEAAEPEMIDKRAQVLRADAGIVAVERRRVDVAAAGIADHAITSLGEHRLLITPDEAATSRRMKEHDRSTLPTGIPVPKLAARDLRHAILGGRLRRDRGW